MVEKDYNSITTIGFLLFITVITAFAVLVLS